MGRASAFGVFVSVVVLGAVDVAAAGGTQPGPPVRVVAPTAANGIKLERDDLPAPPTEVIKHPAKVDTPSVPGFEMPTVEPGFRSARELRVRGKRALGTQVKVKGFVTWVYDCPRALAGANPDASLAQIQEAIRNDQTLCERPMFALGDARDTPRDASILIIDVKIDVKATPRLAVGEHVIASGGWTTPSPHADASDGVLVFGAIERLSPPPPPSAAVDPASLVRDLEIDLDVETPPALRRFVDDVTLNASIEHVNACNKAIVAKQYDAAFVECQAATDAWQDNHLAWYAWASAHMAKREWAQARAMVENAVTLRPDLAMYQLYYGISLYESERQQAREEQARKEGKKPEDVVLDPAMLHLDAARDALTTALKHAPDLWRAHYYLGRIHRDLDDPRRAAQQFTATIKTHPGYRFGYIALSELYRRWDYVDQALAIATLGTVHVAPADAAELWLEVAMAQDAKHAADKAIEAFSKAVNAKPDDAIAKMQRGQIYFHKGELGNAKRDLDDVARSPDPRVASAKPMITQMLAQIASGKRAPPSRSATWDCRRSRNAIVCRPMATQSSAWTRSFRPSRDD
jgi:tetratricopeptide (TPR) repeat protein